MEENQLDSETFSCSICLDLLKDPVTIPCGHNYCMNCIKSHWDKEDQVGIQSCPQCRETFIPRPFLKKNNLVAAVVEQIKKTGLQAAPADHCYIGAEDVVCDICNKGKVKATMSCLVCSYLSLSDFSESAPSHSINVCPLRSWEDVTAVVSELRDKVQDLLRDTWTNFSLTLNKEEPEPGSGTEFLEYSLQITLDPNTANRQLSLSEGNGKVNRMKQPQSYSSHPNRFTDFWQVLSIESLHGRCYWEVEWRGDIDVAVAYKNISRVGEGDECLFGFNEKSWALNCNQGNYTFGHNNIWTPISGPGSSRVGVYLDHRAGVLSFYRVSETRALLHRVQTKFTQPLHAGVWVGTGSSAEFCKPK